MKTKAWLLCTLCAALVLICAYSARAQTTNSNNLTVLGYLAVTNNVYFGTSTATNQYGAQINYTDSNSSVGLTVTRPGATVLFQENATNPKTKLQLDGSNNLTLYGTNGSAGMTLNPNTGGITLAGMGSGIKLADGTVISNAASLRSSVLYVPGTTIPLINMSAGNQGLSLFSGTASGYESFAGEWGTASGNLSMAFGWQTTASGGISTAFGAGTTASGDYSAALGCGTTASGTTSLASGSGAIASGFGSAAFGQSTTASGGEAVAFGYNSTASGNCATVFGQGNFATGDYSTAFGWSSIASGKYSTAIGLLALAPSLGSVSLGQYNVGLVSTNGATNWVPTDPVLEIGNGVYRSPSNAVTIFKSGEIRSQGLIQSKAGVRVPATGNLSMGTYTNGNNPSTLNPATGLLYPGGN